MKGQEDEERGRKTREAELSGKKILEAEQGQDPGSYLANFSLPTAS